MKQIYKKHFLSRTWIDKKPFPDEVPFLNVRESGDHGHDGDGDDGPEHRRNCYEEQQTCQFVGQGMREAEMFIDGQCRYLIDKFDQDNHPGPDPQPRWNLKNGYQFHSATCDEANVGHAVQDSTGLALGVQLPRQVTIQHIADAAKSIDDPERHPCRTAKQQTEGSEKSECR